VTDPLFFSADLGRPAVGSRVILGGEDGRHAAVVRRIRPGEMIMVGDGRGWGVRGEVREVDRDSLVLEVTEQLTEPEPRRKVVAVQALAKGDRSELAVEMLTETGAAEIIPWSAARSVVRWSGERGERSLARWRSTAREAAKQSRRLRVAQVSEPMSTAGVVRLIGTVDRTLVLHEGADQRLVDFDLPDRAAFGIIIGPEGGIAPEELDAFVAAGGWPVSISDGVLRTSTAGAVAVALLRAGEVSRDTLRAKT
jgi:16S rRNA (uracil1498-N3)-methyltransferase